MTKDFKDHVHQRIVLGTSASGEVAIRRARETATPLVVWADGRIQEISAEEASRQRDVKVAEILKNKSQ